MTTASPCIELHPDGSLTHVNIGSLVLESGAVLPSTTIALQSWGHINAARDNVLLIEHALTGDSHVVGPASPQHPSSGWWPNTIGAGAPLDTNKWCVIATNVLGGCQGTTGPSSFHEDGRPWGSRFPWISIRDQVHAERQLADLLHIDRFAAVIGGSMGGMRALEWLVSYPNRVGAGLVLAVGARATADQIGTQTTQIAAITQDPDWQDGNYYLSGRTPTAGLGLARRIAHLTYRAEEELDSRFNNSPQGLENPWDGGRYSMQSYLQHHAEKLIARFDAGTYVVLTEAMNRHDLGRGRNGIAAALATVQAPVVVAGVDSDRLYPIRLQEELVQFIPTAQPLHIILSRDGHDGFLTAHHSVAQLLTETVHLAETNSA